MQSINQCLLEGTCIISFVANYFFFKNYYFRDQQAVTVTILPFFWIVTLKVLHNGWICGKKYEISNAINIQEECISYWFASPNYGSRKNEYKTSIIENTCTLYYLALFEQKYCTTFPIDLIPVYTEDISWFDGECGIYFMFVYTALIRSCVVCEAVNNNMSLKHFENSQSMYELLKDRSNFRNSTKHQ